MQQWNNAGGSTTSVGRLHDGVCHNSVVLLQFLLAADDIVIRESECTCRSCTSCWSCRNYLIILKPAARIADIESQMSDAPTPSPSVDYPIVLGDSYYPNSEEKFYMFRCMEL